MNKFKTYLFVVLYWVLSVNLLSIFGIVGVMAFIDVLELDSNALNNPIAEYWISPFQLLEATLFGIFFGALFVGVNELSEKLKIERFGFGKIIVVKSFGYLAGFIICYVIVYFLLVPLDIFPENSFELITQYRSIYWMFLLIFLMIGVQIVLLNFILQTIKKFGHNNILNFITGKYHHPVVEDRIFLFMDLKSSTMYAERLGNIKYSQLIKDCFDDINCLVDKYNAEIYQYVGDEVVLTWDTKKTLISREYINIFYAFKDLLEARSDHYKKKYGFVPEFKAGLHGGKVTVAEIGNIKREIAYHGDVLNTASRIQSICNEYNQQLLISDDLLQRAGPLDQYRTHFIGHVQLKGKINKIDVHAISLNGATMSKEVA